MTSHTSIGAFARRAGRRACRPADRSRPRSGDDRHCTGSAGRVVISHCIHGHIPLLIVGIILLDAGGQAINVVNQSMIFSTHPEAHTRLVGCCMLFYSIGSGFGAISSTAVNRHSLLSASELSIGHTVTRRSTITRAFHYPSRTVLACFQLYA